MAYNKTFSVGFFLFAALSKIPLKCDVMELGNRNENDKIFRFP